MPGHAALSQDWGGPSSMQRATSRSREAESMGDLDPHQCSASQARGSDRKGNYGYWEIGLSVPFSSTHKRSYRTMCNNRIAQFLSPTSRCNSLMAAIPDS